MKDASGRLGYWLIAFIGIALVLSSSGRAAPKPAPAQTLANLQAAYNGESNAHNRYLVFALKADQEGYGEIASLFRAAARAEQIHLTKHAAVIRKMDAEPAATIEVPLLKSTRENLEAAANKGEAYERDTMYPDFIKQAEADGYPDAVLTFDLARKAEAQHFQLFSHAVENLENMRGKRHTYYVCTVCGYTTPEPVTDNCISCSSPKEKYEAVD